MTLTVTMRTANRFALAILMSSLGAPARSTDSRGSSITIDDFENGKLRAASGLSWISISDDLTGGTSFADLSATAGGAKSKHALRVSGMLAAKGFAGAWSPLDGRARAVDASEFEGIRLKVRGEGKLQISVRGGPGAGANYGAPIESAAEWKSVDVPFSSLAPLFPASPALDLKLLRWLGVSPGPGREGLFKFEVDDVQFYGSRANATLHVHDGPTLTVAFPTLLSRAEMPRGGWAEMTNDPVGDGKQARLPDATALSACLDEKNDRVWFRISLATMVSKRWMGINIALDLDGDPANGMAWWGTNTSFKFDRLVTVFGSETATGYDGAIGVAEAAEVQGTNMMGIVGAKVAVGFDLADPAFIVSVARTSLLADAVAAVRVLVAVGSSFAHNDDLPNSGAAILDLSTPCRF